MKQIKHGAFIFAVLAVFSINATAASADHIQADGYPAEVKAERLGEPHVFTVEGGLAIECETVVYTATLPEAVETIEVLPKFENCIASGLSATVAVEGCKFRLDANASDVDIVCPEGKAIKFVAALGSCEVQVGSQSGVQAGEYENNETNPATVTVKAAATGIKYTKTKDGAFCPLSGLGEKTDGTYTGNTLAGASKGGLIGLFVGPPRPIKLCSEKASSCPEGKVHPANTKISATATSAELRLQWSEGVDWVIECSQWRLTGESQVKENGPEMSVFAQPTFGGCSIVGKGGCDVQMSNSAGGGSMGLVGNGSGRWILGGITTLKISNCAVKTMSKCELRQSLVALDFEGGKEGAAHVVAGPGESFSPHAQEPKDVCPKSVTWIAKYFLQEEAEVPRDVFVTY